MKMDAKNLVWMASALLLAGACGGEDAEGEVGGSDGGMDSGAGAEGGSGDGGTGEDAAFEAGPTVDGVDALPDEVALPMLFVHGFAGSAQQFQSQAMRYEANGYPRGRIRAYEHHGGQVTEDFVAGLSGVVDGMLEEFDVDKIYLLGHSRGTFVSASYLGEPDNAAKVAKYVSLDGIGCGAADTAGVPCIAPSQGNLPGQAHVEVATSKESFEMQYEFLIGEAPEVSEIVPQDEPVVISGRAVYFPENTGRAGTTLEVWPLSEETGQRSGDEPMATFEIDDSGDFGPVTVDPDTFYELVLTGDSGSNHHFFGQRFVRSTPFVRLLSGDPDGETATNTNTGDDHASLIVMRMREWKPSDVLTVETTSEGGDEPAVDVITDEVASSSGGFGSIGIHLHDDTETPGESSLALLPYFAEQSFQTGVDVFMPAADPPDGTITLTNLPYGDEEHPQVIRVANWPSDGHRITVMFADYTQD